jgi:hypothetical protein
LDDVSISFLLYYLVLLCLCSPSWRNF